MIVTGANGFIGKKLATFLEYQGYAVSRLEANDLVGNVSLLSIREKVRGSLCVFHVGAISSTEEKDYNKIYSYNIKSSLDLFAVANAFNIPVVFSSSASVYGNKDTGFIPNTLYSASKAFVESSVGYFQNKIACLRYFNVYGPGEENKGRGASLAYQAWLANSRGEKFKLIKTDAVRDFVHIDDVVMANFAAFNHLVSNNINCNMHNIFDVGSGLSIRFDEFLSFMGVDFEIVERELPFWYQKYTQARPGMAIPYWSPTISPRNGAIHYKKYLDSSLAR